MLFKAKGLISGLVLKSQYFTVIFWFIQAKAPLRAEVKKGKKKVDEQLLRSLILFWELVAAMSAKVLFFCWCK